jgi:hypothetical protein
MGQFDGEESLVVHPNPKRKRGGNFILAYAFEVAHFV